MHGARTPTKYREQQCACMLTKHLYQTERYMNMLISTWVLLAAGLVFAFPMIYSRVKNHTELEDETLYVYFICCIVARLI